MFELFYHPIYTDGIDERSRFPKERYKLTKKILDKSKSNIRFIKPIMAKLRISILRTKRNMLIHLLLEDFRIKKKEK